MTMVTLVLRNLLRRPARTLLTAAGVALGVGLIVALLSISTGVQRTADELGLDMPAMGTSPAGAVGRAVVAAIQKDRPEIVVMPGPGRLLKALMDLFPSLGPAMNEAAGANATMDRVIEHRRRTVA